MISINEYVNKLIEEKQNQIIEEQLDPRIKEKISIGGMFLLTMIVTVIIALKQRRLSGKETVELLKNNSKFNVQVQNVSKQFYNALLQIDPFFKKYLKYSVIMDRAEFTDKSIIIPIIKIDGKKMWQDITGYNSAEDYERKIKWEEPDSNPIHPQFTKILRKLIENINIVNDKAQDITHTDMISIYAYYAKFMDHWELYQLGCYDEHKAEKCSDYIMLKIKLKEYKNAKEVQDWVDKQTNK